MLSFILCCGFAQVGVILMKPDFLNEDQIEACQKATDQISCFSELPGILGVEKEVGKKGVYYLRLYPRIPVARYKDGFVDRGGVYFKVSLRGAEVGSLPTFSVPISSVLRSQQLCDELSGPMTQIEKVSLDAAGQWEVLLKTKQLIKLGSDPFLHIKRIKGFFSKFEKYQQDPGKYFDFRNKRQVAIGQLN